MSRHGLNVQHLDIGASRFDELEARGFTDAGYGRVPQVGDHPALIIVDMTYEFCGRPGSRGSSSAISRKASDAAAWKAIKTLVDLLPAFRAAEVPIIYSRNAKRSTPVEQGSWKLKTDGQAPDSELEIVAEVAPLGSDLVVEKSKPSAFFGTPLTSWLIELGVDTVFLSGGTTSGCVRATVTDAFSHNLRPFVIVDAVFDRSPTSHEVNLYEMQQKYAGLVHSDQLAAWLRP